MILKKEVIFFENVKIFFFSNIKSKISKNIQFQKKTLLFFTKYAFKRLYLLFVVNKPIFMAKPYVFN